MTNLYPNSKFYIYAPWHGFTGGPELLHQLGSTLMRMNLDVSMCYYNPDQNLPPIHPQLKKYHLPYVYDEQIEDSERNIIVVPEILSYPLERFQKTQKIFWWLSVDNYFNAIAPIINSIMHQRAFQKIRLTLLEVMSLPNVEHWVQSEYAREFLEFNQVPCEKIKFVGDYLVPTFLEQTNSINIDAKEDLIAFNPKKGFELTKQLISSATDLKFAPIQNMTSEQVQQLLAKSKIYIDFGNHPGQDRIPREAAASHCVVVTGRRGSAGNDIDIPIPSDFKFDDSIGNDEKIIPQIAARLRDILKNFRAEHDRQNSYRDMIFEQPIKFVHDVAQAIKIVAPLPKKISIAGNLAEITKLFEKFIPRKNFEILFVVSNEIKSRGIYYGDKMFPIISEFDAKFLCNENRIDFIVGSENRLKKMNLDYRYWFVS